MATVIPSRLHAAQLDKTGLTAELVENVILCCYKTPTARMLKDVEIPLGCRKLLVPKPPTQILVGTGRSCVNPCEQCDFAEQTGEGGFCGQCRSRPLVMRRRAGAIYLFSLSAHGLARSSDSPRTSYLRNLGNFTCGNCGEIYFNNHRERQHIEHTGECLVCHLARHFT